MPRSVVLGMDDLERKVGWVAAAVAVALAAIIAPHLLHNTIVTHHTARTATGCPANYHLVKGTCTWNEVTHPLDWLPQFLEILILAGVIALFTARRRRAFVAGSALLLGLALGTAGFPFILVGGWYIVRAFRLQKYGDATFVGSSRRAREAADARRATRRSQRGSKGPVSPSRPAAPSASKRYTPKKPSRRK